MSEKGIFSNLYLLKLMIKRDMARMYRRSLLGYVWSVLNPLGIMLVMTFVFTNLFKIEVEYYAAYIITGQLVFDFISSATQQSIFSVVGNASLLKKTNVPKHIFTVATVTSRLINMLFSLVAMFFVMIVTKVPFTPYILLFPLVLVQCYFFAMGISLFLSQLSVFFRDIQYMYSVFITAWVYCSAIFYPADTLTGAPAFLITRLNPLYFYVYEFRCFMMYGKMPEPYYLFMGALWAAVSTLAGFAIFKKNQNKFFLYI